MSTPHGILLIDKPAGCTSHHVVDRVRRILGLRAVGHAGTLDPIATGLLVILLGEGTKISDYVLSGDKGYRACIRLGVRTDTQDLTGQVLAERPVDVTAEQVARVVQDLTGEIELSVPAFSAVKVQGRKLYEYARAEAPVERPVRIMDFRSVEMRGFSGCELEVDMLVSKGSYVRAWADELGERLGTGAALQSLRRTLSDPYRVEQAISLEGLEQLMTETGSLSALEGEAFIPLAATLPMFASVNVVGHERTLIENGQIASSLRGRLLQDLRHSSGRKILDHDGRKMLALVVSDTTSTLSIRRVFRY